MPRIRQVKPEFFNDAKLLELSPLHRLLFAGLWCWADREGRLLDRPGDLKIRILPVDRCNVDAMLTDLASSGFVMRYEVEGERYLCVKHFRRHQHLHVNEAISTLPAPCSNGACDTGVAPEQHRASTHTSASTSASTSTKEEEGSDGASAPTPILNAFELQELWNATASPVLPRWQGMTDKRKKAAQRILALYPLEKWPAILERLNRTPFLLGENQRGWKADPDFIVKPDSIQGLMEGKYDRAPSTNSRRADPNQGITRGG